MDYNLGDTVIVRVRTNFHYPNMCSFSVGMIERITEDRVAPQLIGMKFYQIVTPLYPKITDSVTYLASDIVCRATPLAQILYE